MTQTYAAKHRYRSDRAGVATASCVLGVTALPLTFVVIGVPLAVAAVILGHLAQYATKGNMLATVGVVTGYISLGISVLIVTTMLIVG